MVLTYKLQKDLCGRAATQLRWHLQSLKSEVRIMTERMINAKSLVGVLSAQLRTGNHIAITFDCNEEENKIREEFNEIGCEINELLEQQS